MGTGREEGIRAVEVSLRAAGHDVSVPLAAPATPPETGTSIHSAGLRGEAGGDDAGCVGVDAGVVDDVVSGTGDAEGDFLDRGNGGDTQDDHVKGLHDRGRVGGRMGSCGDEWFRLVGVLFQTVQRWPASGRQVSRRERVGTSRPTPARSAVSVGSRSGIATFEGTRKAVRQTGREADADADRLWGRGPAARTRVVGGRCGGAARGRGGLGGVTTRRHRDRLQDGGSAVVPPELPQPPASGSSSSTLSAAARSPAIGATMERTYS